MSSSSNTTPDGAPTFEPGGLVSILGLQSQAGKKLNGSKGLILGPPTTEDGVTRYPVVIYAVLVATYEYLTLLSPTTNKKLKECNLEENGDKSFLYEAAYQQVYAEKDKGNDTKALFWMEVLHREFPEDYGLGIPYAHNLRQTWKKPEEAYQVILKYVDTYPVPEDSPHYPKFCNEVSHLFAYKRHRLPEALEFALKMPYENCSPEQKVDSQLALEAIIKGCRKKVESELENPQAAAVYVSTVEALIERFPEDPAFDIGTLAAAHGLSGNYLKCVELRRQALALKSSAVNVKSRNYELIKAQLRCPGMPLEGCFLVNADYADCEKDKYPKILPYVLNSDKAAYKEFLEELHSTVNPKQFLIDGFYMPPNLDVKFYELPESPDDPNHFPDWFLKQFQGEDDDASDYDNVD